MAKKTKAQLENELREQIFALIIPILDKEIGEVLKTANNERSIPVVDSEGNERFANIQVIIPRGQRDGTPYDGYAAAQSFREEQEQKIEDKRANDAIKARDAMLKQKRADERRIKRLAKIKLAEKENGEPTEVDSEENAANLNEDTAED